MYKSEVTLDAPAAKVFELVNPAKKYRIQWDGYLERLDVTKQISDVRDDDFLDFAYLTDLSLFLLFVERVFDLSRFEASSQRNHVAPRFYRRCYM